MLGERVATLSNEKLTQGRRNGGPCIPSHTHTHNIYIYIYI